MRYEHLGGGAFAAVTPDYTFGEDALRLARFAAPRAGERICDLGTGCGILAVLLLREGAESAAVVDIQPEAVRLAALSLEKSGFAGRYRAVCADWAVLAESGLPREGFDRVVCNPPYFPAGSGGVPAGEARRIARHEEAGALPAACRAAARLLRFGGRFCLCHRPERLIDVTENLRAAGLEPKRLRPVCRRAGDAPWLFLLEARRGGKPGLLWEAPDGSL